MDQGVDSVSVEWDKKDKKYLSDFFLSSARSQAELDLQRSVKINAERFGICINRNEIKKAEVGLLCTE